MGAVTLQHSGLGDYIICNGLTRHLQRLHRDVVIPVKNSNFPSIQHMYSDEPNIKVIEVEGDRGARDVTDEYVNKGYNKVGVGIFFPGPFNSDDFAIEFYRQANVDYSHRVSSFRFPLLSADDIRVWNHYKVKSPYIFMHNDPSRKMTIDINKVLQGRDMPIVSPIVGLTDKVFNYRLLIEGASEIHCIDSSFAHLCESLHYNDNIPMFAHSYARPGKQYLFPDRWIKIH